MVSKRNQNWNGFLILRFSVDDASDRSNLCLVRKVRIHQYNRNRQTKERTMHFSVRKRERPILLIVSRNYFIKIHVCIALKRSNQFWNGKTGTAPTACIASHRTLPIGCAVAFISFRFIFFHVWYGIFIVLVLVPGPYHPSFHPREVAAEEGAFRAPRPRAWVPPPIPWEPPGAEEDRHQRASPVPVRLA